MTDPAPMTEDAAAEGGLSVDAARLGARLGRYKLVLPLAQGGMGLVFAGRLMGPHGVERLVALKTLRPITSKSDRVALLREAKLTARLHHRNVVATLDLGEVDDVPYVVMELIDGVAFSRLLSTLRARGERLAPEIAAWTLMQAAQGLHAAHELTDAEGQPLGLVHRDVSPQNILLSTQGEVKLADFGIAKFAGRDESTATGMLKGKFGYMSPEQAQCSELDRRSDVFALGVVLWEALVGDKLFSAETPARSLLRVIEHVPRAPVELRPEVGRELSDVAMRCLEKEPARRYPSAAAVADALRLALRARATPVDEGELAALVKEHFGEERARIMERVRGDVAVDVAPPKAPTSADASGLRAVSLSTAQNTGTASPAHTSRARPSRLALAALAAVALAAGGWAVRGRLSASSVPSASSTSSARAPMAPFAVGPAEAASASSLSSPGEKASGAAFSVSVAASGAPSASALPSAPRPVVTSRPSRQAPRAVGTAKPSASVVPPPAPAASSLRAKPTGGQPFESL